MKQFATRTHRAVVDYGIFVVFIGFAVTGIWLFLNRDSINTYGLLSQYWLAAIFCIFILEGAMLLYFAPSESIIPIAVGLTLETNIASPTPTTFVLILGVAVVGATIGQSLLFGLAKRWGRERLLEKPWFRVSDSTLEKFESWFSRWGIFAVPVSNALPFTRGMLTVPAGIAEMKAHRFVLLSAVGTLVFEVLLALLALGVVNIYL